jgi:hypothetical protein
VGTGRRDEGTTEAKNVSHPLSCLFFARPPTTVSLVTTSAGSGGRHAKHGVIAEHELGREHRIKLEPREAEVAYERAARRCGSAEADLQREARIRAHARKLEELADKSRPEEIDVAPVYLSVPSCDPEYVVDKKVFGQSKASNGKRRAITGALGSRRVASFGFWILPRKGALSTSFDRILFQARNTPKRVQTAISH